MTCVALLSAPGPIAQAPICGRVTKHCMPRYLGGETRLHAAADVCQLGPRPVEWGSWSRLSFRPPVRLSDAHGIRVVSPTASARPRHPRSPPSVRLSAGWRDDGQLSRVTFRPNVRFGSRLWHAVLAAGATGRRTPHSRHEPASWLRQLSRWHRLLGATHAARLVSVGQVCVCGAPMVVTMAAIPRRR